MLASAGHPMRGSPRIMREASSRSKRRQTVAWLCFAWLVCGLAGGGQLAAGAEPRDPTVPLYSAEPDGSDVDAPAKSGAEAEEHGLPRNAVEIGRPFGFPITNSMVVSWMVAVGLIVFAQLAT